MTRRTVNKTITKHHRKPKAHGGPGTAKSGNITMVRDEKHKAWHSLFGITTPPQIAKRMNEVWIDPDWIMVAIPQKDIIENCGNTAQCIICGNKFDPTKKGGGKLTYHLHISTSFQQIDFSLLLYCSDECLEKFP